VPTVVVYENKHAAPRASTPFTEGRDVWYDDAIAGQPTSAEVEWVGAEHPLFLLYTSGSTGACVRACVRACVCVRAWRAARAPFPPVDLWQVSVLTLVPQSINSLCVLTLQAAPPPHPHPPMRARARTRAPTRTRTHTHTHTHAHARTRTRTRAGKPKGVVHCTGGYMVYAHTTTKYVFNMKPGDVYWCTADCGWITGHTYLTYGPLLVGATNVVFEGVPTYPGPDRCWQVVDKYQVRARVHACASARLRARVGCGGRGRAGARSARVGWRQPASAADTARSRLVCRQRHAALPMAAARARALLPPAPCMRGTQVRQFYTAPTAIRSLMRAGDLYVKEHLRDSLRILGSVGEPINPEAWKWCVEWRGVDRARQEAPGQPTHGAQWAADCASTHSHPLPPPSTAHTHLANPRRPHTHAPTHTHTHTHPTGTTTLWATAAAPWSTRGGRRRRAVT
jgi:hypothetical protein